MQIMEKKHFRKVIEHILYKIYETIIQSINKLPIFGIHNQKIKLSIQSNTFRKINYI